MKGGKSSESSSSSLDSWFYGERKSRRWKAKRGITGVENVFKDDSHTARKLENRGISEKLRSCMYIRLYTCVCVLNGARSRGVDKWVDDDPAAGQSEYIDAHVHTPVKENGRRGRFSGGALMRMLLIIQFVNSRYILIVLAEPRVTRITSCFMPSDFLSSFILRFSSFPRANLSVPIFFPSREKGE